MSLDLGPWGPDLSPRLSGCHWSTSPIASPDLAIEGEEVIVEATTQCMLALPWQWHCTVSRISSCMSAHPLGTRLSNHTLSVMTMSHDLWNATTHTERSTGRRHRGARPQRATGASGSGLWNWKYEPLLREDGCNKGLVLGRRIET
jgi:hypothetical protein